MAFVATATMPLASTTVAAAAAGMSRNAKVARIDVKVVGGAAVTVHVVPRRADDGRARVGMSGRRGDLGVAFGKKKKGFAELMGGGDDDASAVVTKNKGAAPEADRCPCGGGDDKLPYSRCCKPYHKGEKYPEDCVTLMRSRFTGYAKGEGEYVVRTTHPDNPIFKDGAKAESGKVRRTTTTHSSFTVEKDSLSSSRGMGARFVKSFVAVVLDLGAEGSWENALVEEKLSAAQGTRNLARVQMVEVGFLAPVLEKSLPFNLYVS